jgi:hypothetical protein
MVMVKLLLFTGVRNAELAHVQLKDVEELSRRVDALPRKPNEKIATCTVSLAMS